MLHCSSVGADIAGTSLDYMWGFRLPLRGQLIKRARAAPMPASGCLPTVPTRSWNLERLQGLYYLHCCSTSRAHGVVVSHPLRMRKALGSIPSVSSFSATPRHFSNSISCWLANSSSLCKSQLDSELPSTSTGVELGLSSWPPATKRRARRTHDELHTSLEVSLATRRAHNAYPQTTLPRIFLQLAWTRPRRTTAAWRPSCQLLTAADLSRLLAHPR